MGVIYIIKTTSDTDIEDHSSPEIAIKFRLVTQKFRIPSMLFDMVRGKEWPIFNDGDNVDSDS